MNNKKQQQKKQFSVNYILTYTKNSYQIKSIVNKYWLILASDPSLKDVFKQPPMFTYKRSSNLANMLVRSDVVRDDKKTYIQGCFPCRN